MFGQSFVKGCWHHQNILMATNWYALLLCNFQLLSVIFEDCWLEDYFTLINSIKEHKKPAHMQFLFTRQALFTNEQARFYERVSEWKVILSELKLYVQGTRVIKGLVHAKHQYRYFNFISLKSQMILSHHRLHHSLISHITNPHFASCSVRSYQEQSTIGAISTVLECWDFYRRLQVVVTKISWYFY